MAAEINLMDEIIVDNFAGGGGASTGMELAAGRPVAIAINHDPAAILMHRTNHPYTEHLQASVWDVDPKEVCRGRPVGLAWFSPDCFEAGTLVLTDSGYKPIEEIKVGEKVLTHKMRWRTVTATMVTERDEMIVKGYGHPGIVCSTGHPFYVRTRSTDGTFSDPEWKKAKELTRADYWGSPMSAESLPIPEIDGSGMGVRVAEMRLAGKMARGETKCGWWPKFNEWFNENFGETLANRKIPAWLFGASEELRKAFLDGFVDALFVDPGTTVWEIVNSKEMAYSLKTLAVTLGYRANVSVRKIAGREERYMVEWKSEVDGTLKSDNILWTSIRSAKQTGNRKMFYNISVEEDESYIAEGIIVHNCKHFSKAKGSALVNRNIRGLAWIVLRWAGTVRPRVIMLENVEEFQTWGPVRKGKPVKSKAGETFQKWKKQLSDLGYEIEHRELVMADYGAPTTRKRFALIARCDGKPIVWPERTHAPADSEEVKSGKLKPWVSAAEIIDWSIPGYSIFASKQEIKEKYNVNAVRPLAKNTMRRIIRGVDKFTLKSGKPFIVPTGYGERKGQKPRVHDIDNPVSTIVSTVKQNVCQPVLMEAPSLIQYHTEQSDYHRGQGLRSPLQTVDSSNRYGLATASLVEYYGNGNPLDMREPMHTVTSHDREAVVMAHVAEFKGTDVGQDVRRPLRTITASAGEFGAVTVKAEKYEPGADLGYWPQVRSLLNEFCDYNLADNEVLLLNIGGVQYYIGDISLRMLTPRELYRAMGFPNDYKIDHDYKGNKYNKTAQVARCGNAVCPAMAEALVRANIPEWCTKKRTTMEELDNDIAV